MANESSYIIVDAEAGGAAYGGGGRYLQCPNDVPIECEEQLLINTSCSMTMYHIPLARTALCAHN